MFNNNEGELFKCENQCEVTFLAQTKSGRIFCEQCLINMEKNDVDFAIGLEAIQFEERNYGTGGPIIQAFASGRYISPNYTLGT